MKRGFWNAIGLLVAVFTPLVAVHAADTTRPTLQYFSSETSSGTYGAGANIVFGARYTETLGANSSLTVVLNTTPVQREVVLNRVAGSRVSGTYTVAAGDTSTRLKVLRIKAGSESVRDIAGNIRTNTTSSAYAGADNLDNPERIIIDTTAPATPIASPVGGSYKTSKNIKLSVPGEPSATKIYYTLDGTSPTVASKKFGSSIIVRTNTTIKAIARDAAGNIGPILVAVYAIGSATPTPTQTPTSTYVPTPIVTPTPTPTQTPTSTYLPLSAHISYLDSGELGYATNESGSWVTKTIDGDSRGNVASAGYKSDLAVDSNGKIHISHQGYPNGVKSLKYTTNISGDWVTSVVAQLNPSVINLETSIVIDSNNKVHISYNDLVTNPVGGAKVFNLKYATNASGSWVVSTIDANPGVGRYNSIALDKNDKVHISYHDGVNLSLKYATNVSGSWVTQTLDTQFSSGYGSSIKIDSQNKVHISYVSSVSEDNRHLKYATNVSGDWVLSTIESNGLVGQYNSLVLDSHDKAHIGYDQYTSKSSQYTDSDLKYATNTSGSWITSTIDQAGKIIQSIALAIDSQDNLYVSYYDQQDDGVRYATNASGSWVISVVDLNTRTSLDHTSIGVFGSSAPTPTPAPTETPTSTNTPNPIITLTAAFTQPIANMLFTRGQQIPITVVAHETGSSSDLCGTWELVKPNGEVVTLKTEDFSSEKLPRVIPPCVVSSY